MALHALPVRLSCSWLDPPRYWIDEARGLYVGDALPARSDAIGSLVREDASSHLEHLPS